MRVTTVNLDGVLLEVAYEYTGAYKGSETDPPEPASVELQGVYVPGTKRTGDLLDYLTPGALALIEEQLMEMLEDGYDD